MNHPLYSSGRRVATILLTLGVSATAVVTFFQFPVSPLPQAHFFSVTVQLPGASPDVVTTAVATPSGASPWPDRASDGPYR
jgi:multidrug efflux pump